METPRTPQMTTTNTVYPTPNSIRFRSQTSKVPDPTYLPMENDHRASDDEYEWFQTGTKRPRKSNDPTYRPTEEDYQHLDDKYEWLPSGTKRARKSKTVDPTYRPEYVPGDSDDEAMSPTERRLSRKRNGISRAVTKTVEGQCLFMRPPKRAKVSSGVEARAKAEIKSSPRLEDITDHTHNHTERPTTPKGQILNPLNYPTPSSLLDGLSGKDTLFQSHLANPKSPILDPGSFLKPELPDDENRDPTWDSPKSLKRGRSVSRRADDDDLYCPPSKAVKTVFSRRQLLTGANEGLSDDEDDEYEYDDECGVSKSETKGVVYDFSLERAKRWAAAVSLPEDAWSEAEKELFFRLAMRGFEPLLPLHWQHDFSTLPNTMFSLPEEETAPIIRAFKQSDFRAIKSLLGLFSLGGQVRDCNILQTRPENKIRRAIKKYVLWAMRDADIHEEPGTIPVYAIRSQKEGESVVSAVSKLNNRLGKLAKQYHGALGMASRVTVRTPGAPISQELDTDLRITSRRNYPLLVGFVICGPIVAILTLDTDPLSPKGWGEGTGSKFISQFDVGERGQDVWTSLALAITIMHIRKTMIQLADNGKGGFCRNGGDVLVGEDEDI